MQKKFLITITLVVIASLSIAGCTTSTNNTGQTSSATSSTTSAASQHNASLEKYITSYKTVQYSNSSQRVTAWKLVWNNNTSAHVTWTAVRRQTNGTETVTLDRTFIVFPTAQVATNYVNRLNLTAYTLVSTNPQNAAVYKNVTGHTPQIYKEYAWTQGSLSNVSSYRAHRIEQADNIVAAETLRVLVSWGSRFGSPHANLRRHRARMCWLARTRRRQRWNLRYITCDNQLLSNRDRKLRLFLNPNTQAIFWSPLYQINNHFCLL